MRGAHSKATVFVLGLAGCAIPCVALALNEPSEELTSSATPTAIKDDLALIPNSGIIEPETKGEWGVQVGVFATRDEAQAQLDRLVALAPDHDLQQGQFVVPHKDDSHNEFYRAQFTGLTESDARSLCNTLADSGTSCFIFRTATFDSDQPLEAGSSPQAAGKEASIEGSAANGNLALATLQPISNDDLANARGGFSVGGVNFNFGASVQTLVNGQLALQTTVQWTPTGAVVTQLQGLGTKIDAQVTSTLADAGITTPTTGNAAPVSTTSLPLTQTASTIPSSISTAPASAPGNSPVTVPTTSSPISPTGVIPAMTASLTNAGGGIPSASAAASTSSAALTVPTTAASLTAAIDPAVSSPPANPGLSLPIGSPAQVGTNAAGTTSATPVSTTANPAVAAPTGITPTGPVISNAPQSGAIASIAGAQTPINPASSITGGSTTPLSTPTAPSTATTSNVASIPTTVSNPPTTNAPVPVDFAAVASTASTSSPSNGLASTGSTSAPNNIANVPTTVSNPPTTNTPVPVNFAAVASTGSTSSPSNGLASTGSASAPNNIATVPTTVSNPPTTTVTVPINFVNVPSSSSGSTSSAISGASSSQLPAVAALPTSLGVLSPTSASNAGSQAGTNTSATNSSLNAPIVVTGVQIQTDTGTTQVLANVTNGQIQNIILNTASNQNIVQNTNITLTIYNFAAWQQTLAQNSMAMQLANQLLAASGFRGLH